MSLSSSFLRRCWKSFCNTEYHFLVSEAHSFVHLFSTSLIFALHELLMIPILLLTLFFVPLAISLFSLVFAVLNHPLKRLRILVQVLYLIAYLILFGFFLGC